MPPESPLFRTLTDPSERIIATVTHATGLMPFLS